jgi:hypothetical protein
MAIWNNSDDLKELRSEFEHLKEIGTEERIVKDDNGLYYRRFFKITEYKITEAIPDLVDHDRYVMASWRADIIYTKDVRTEIAAEKAMLKEPDSCYVNWEAVFKQTPEGYVVINVFYKILSVDSQGDARSTTDKRHYVFDWASAFNWYD